MSTQFARQGCRTFRASQLRSRYSSVSHLPSAALWHSVQMSLHAALPAQQLCVRRVCRRGGQRCKPSICRASPQEAAEPSRRTTLAGLSLAAVATLGAPALGAAALSVVELTPSNFDEVLRSNKRVFLEAYAPWCPYCKALEPAYTQLPTQLLATPGAPATTVARMDVDAYTDYATRFGVRAFPTFVLFVDGRAVGQHVGSTDADGLLRYASALSGGAPAGAPTAPVVQEAGLDLVLTERAQRGLLDEIKALRDELGAGASSSALGHLDTITGIVTASTRLL